MCPHRVERVYFRDGVEQGVRPPPHGVYARQYGGKDVAEAAPLDQLAGPLRRKRQQQGLVVLGGGWGAATCVGRGEEGKGMGAQHFLRDSSLYTNNTSNKHQQQS